MFNAIFLENTDFEVVLEAVYLLDIVIIIFQIKNTIGQQNIWNVEKVNYEQKSWN